MSAHGCTMCPVCGAWCMFCCGCNHIPMDAYSLSANPADWVPIPELKPKFAVFQLALPGFEELVDEG